VLKFSPELTKRTEKHLQRASVVWHVGEAYICVGGKWRYLWRAVDANGQMVDFRLAAHRDAKAAKAFLNKAIAGVRLHRPVSSAPIKRQPIGVLFVRSIIDMIHISTVSDMLIKSGATT
jgi:hypothetical protein